MAVASVVSLAAYLLFATPVHGRRDPAAPLVLARASAISVGVAVAAFALAIVLLAVTGPS